MVREFPHHLRARFRELQRFGNETAIAAVSEVGPDGTETYNLVAVETNLAKFRECLNALYKDGYLSDSILPIIAGADLAYELLTDDYSDLDDVLRRATILARMNDRPDPHAPSQFPPHAPWNAVKDWIFAYTTDILIDVHYALQLEPVRKANH